MVERNLSELRSIRDGEERKSRGETTTESRLQRGVNLDALVPALIEL